MFYKTFVRPLLFLFDSESIHDFALSGLAAGYRWLESLRFLHQDPALHQKLFDIDFRSPIGLAAGFDKFAKAIPAWNAMGFGFAEIGTVTGQPQAGNDKPRLFRLRRDHALINRFGFNNDGAAKTAQTLAYWMNKKKLRSIPIGINIGKTKSVETDKAFEDYLFSFHELWPFADYFTINVSSPNTPDLRRLQEKPFLVQILKTLASANQKMASENRSSPRPIFVKIAPDLSWEQIDDVLQAATECGIQGIIATNTTVQRELLKSKESLKAETGGLSGQPLTQRSTEIIRYIYKNAGSKLIIIGVGGIFTGNDAYEKIKAGASLVQVYTGFIYEGPMICRKINRRLAALLHKDGFKNISEAVGKNG